VRQALFPTVSTKGELRPMSTTLLRTRHCWYWLSPAGAILLTHGTRSSPSPLSGSTAELMADLDAVEGAVSRARRYGRPVPVESLDLVPPVSTPCRVLSAYGAYRAPASPRRRATREPLAVVLRSSDALAGPGQPLLRPPHVRLLEQGVEVGLVVSRTVEAGASVADDEAHHFVGGLVLAGSAVARDVELETGHPVEASSYPSFTGLAPALVLVDQDELKRVVDLRLTVSVNGRLRQDVLVGEELVREPVEVLRAACRFQRLDPGDLVLTGAPRHEPGAQPTRLDRAVEGLLDPSGAARRTVSRELRSGHVLRDGDTVQVRAATGDGTLDLGSINRVVLRAPR
jgi:2-keto-4-pentenoate hydratase/2-oxohepta-3-ene-1,7-dioic acid hydratase in catechol pathway